MRVFHIYTFMPTRKLPKDLCAGAWNTEVFVNRIKEITPADETARIRANERWNSVAKPLGSLGLLENAVEKIAAIMGCENVDIGKRAVVVMCADNGVVCEGVTQSDSSVTGICAKAIAEGTSNINRMAQSFGAEVFAVDIGINRDVECERLLKRKIAYGTENIAAGPAMTSAQTEQAIIMRLETLKNVGLKKVDLSEVNNLAYQSTSNLEGLKQLHFTIV